MTPESCAKEMSAAEKCAVEICKKIDYTFTAGADSVIAEIVQRLLSSEVARVHGEYQKLAKGWRNDMAALNGFTGDVAQFRKAVLECASRVEALAPNKEGQK